MRLIDADALMKEMDYHFRHIGRAEEVRDMISNMPTIIPRPDWTPCADGLPTPDAEENGVCKRYLCTTSTPSGKFVVVELIYITIGKKPVWYDNDYYELFEGSGYQVTAWMPRPDPYNTDRKEDAKSDDVSQWPDWKQRAALSNYDFKKEDSE